MSTATSEQTNKVTISDAGPSAKRVSIEIPAEVVTRKLRESLDTIAVEAALPGFRKGRVPRWLVEKKFGSALRKEAKTELVTQAVNQAVEENKLKVVSEPTAESLPTLDLEEGKAFSFDVEVEVLPEFQLPALEGIKVKKPTIAITDAMIDDEVRKLCINEGSLESRENAEAGDYITGHAIMVDAKGHEFYNLKGAVVQKPTADKEGKGMILGIMVDDFDKQLGSPKAGDTATIKAKGPENHEVEGIRNAELTITFHAERVDRILPAPVDQIVQGLGFESEQRLRDAIRQRMEQRVMIQQVGVMHQQIAKHLIDSTQMELPQRMSAQQASRTLERRRLELMYRGVDAQQIEEHMAELRASSSADASRDLKLFFILYSVAEQFKVRVDENEISQRIAQMAAQRNVRPEQLRADLIRTRQVNGIYQQIRDHKALDAILSRASVEEMPADEFNKMMKEQGTAAV